MNLDLTTKSLEVKLGGSVTTNQLPWVAHYVDINQTTVAVTSIAEVDGLTNNAIAVTMVSAPASGVTRQIKEFTVENNDTVNATVIIQLNDNGTKQLVINTTLVPNSTLVFANGNFSIVPITNQLTIPISVPNGGTGDTTLTAHGVLIGEGTNSINTTAVGTNNTVLHGNTGADPTFSAVVENDISLSDVTTDDVSISKHGFVPKAPNDNTKVLQGDGTWAVRTSIVSSNSTGNLNGAWFILPKTDRVTLYMTNASLSTIQSIPAGYDGQELTIISQGAGQVDCSNNDAGGTTGQKLHNIVTSGKTSLAAGTGNVVYIFDATNTRWNLIEHEQGASIAIPFSAGNFTGNGAMTWTVIAGNQIVLSYILRGRVLMVEIDIRSTTVGGTPNTALQITIPFTAAAHLGFYYARRFDNGTAGAGLTEVNGTLIQCFSTIDAQTNWNLSTTSTSFQSTTIFEVT